MAGGVAADEATGLAVGAAGEVRATDGAGDAAWETELAGDDARAGAGAGATGDTAGATVATGAVLAAGVPLAVGALVAGAVWG